LVARDRMGSGFSSKHKFFNSLLSTVSTQNNVYDKCDMRI
jgi:hypothetical protein